MWSTEHSADRHSFLLQYFAHCRQLQISPRVSTVPWLLAGQVSDQDAEGYRWPSVSRCGLVFRSAAGGGGGAGLGVCTPAVAAEDGAQDRRRPQRQTADNMPVVARSDAGARCRHHTSPEPGRTTATWPGISSSSPSRLMQLDAAGFAGSQCCIHVFIRSTARLPDYERMWAIM